LILLKKLIGVNRVIYGVQGVPVPPLFGLRGTVPPLFRTKKVKNLLSTEAIAEFKLQ